MLHTSTPSLPPYICRTLPASWWLFVAASQANLQNGRHLPGSVRLYISPDSCAESQKPIFKQQLFHWDMCAGKWLGWWASTE